MLIREATNTNFIVLGTRPSMNPQSKALDKQANYNVTDVVVSGEDKCKWLKDNRQQVMQKAHTTLWDSGIVRI